jgi:hypothetical protein
LGKLYYTIYVGGLIVPQVRFTTSILGASIVGDVKKFLTQNAKAVANETSMTPEQGAEALANAICYGIAKAMSSPSFQAALAAGVGPASAGSLINTALQPSVLEPI